MSREAGRAPHVLRDRGAVGFDEDRETMAIRRGEHRLDQAVHVIVVFEAHAAQRPEPGFRLGRQLHRLGRALFLR